MVKQLETVVERMDKLRTKVNADDLEVGELVVIGDPARALVHVAKVNPKTFDGVVLEFTESGQLGSWSNLPVRYYKESIAGGVTEKALARMPEFAPTLSGRRSKNLPVPFGQLALQCKRHADNFLRDADKKRAKAENYATRRATRVAVNRPDSIARLADRSEKIASQYSSAAGLFKRAARAITDSGE